MPKPAPHGNSLLKEWHFHLHSCPSHKFRYPSFALYIQSLTKSYECNFSRALYLSHFSWFHWPFPCSRPHHHLLLTLLQQPFNRSLTSSLPTNHIPADSGGFSNMRFCLEVFFLLHPDALAQLSHCLGKLLWPLPRLRLFHPVMP